MSWCLSVKARRRVKHNSLFFLSSRPMMNRWGKAKCRMVIIGGTRERAWKIRRPRWLWSDRCSTSMSSICYLVVHQRRSTKRWSTKSQRRRLRERSRAGCRRARGSSRATGSRRPGVPWRPPRSMRSAPNSCGASARQTFARHSPSRHPVLRTRNVRFIENDQLSVVYKSIFNSMC